MAATNNTILSTYQANTCSMPGCSPVRSLESLTIFLSVLNPLTRAKLLF